MPGAPSTASLIKDLNLEEHPEGGYYALTDSQGERVASPFSEGNQERPLATSIYYLLTRDRPAGLFHMNKSVTYHVLHHGRAEYTLITPGRPPTVARRVLGTDVRAGETRLLVVGTGVWKRSALLAADLAGDEEEEEHAQCLITEVVVPGFDWADHVYMDRAALEALFDGVDGGARLIEEFAAFVGASAPGAAA
ncbi:hypothetical protein HYPSUDRAFT_48543 [Hypholoma sublateritium FD-334 SS-4]|uniref:DUF985 domain-containing protein n=1 Tax=Hypholoma sublateritium (strain FD-334 SS-4) TaxID=945553 RepID=A0A0D2N823_HYPSF|nr:hypothetical protein HYPSUDRAFT_48543 [Hypholoma sublateritium FD-334 SS-4]